MCRFADGFLISIEYTSLSSSLNEINTWVSVCQFRRAFLYQEWFFMIALLTLLVKNKNIFTLEDTKLIIAVTDEKAIPFSLQF